MPTLAPDVAALMERVKVGLDAITFDRDDAASIRAALLAGRHVMEGELWPHRDNGQAIKACRELWNGVLDGVLHSGYQAGLTDQERDWLCQWQPMPEFDSFYFPELD